MRKLANEIHPAFFQGRIRHLHICRFAKVRFARLKFC